VALSRAQADLIEDLINVRRLEDRRYDERFSPELRERFFVKNLENVQGDERDHIILSIGYGPTSGTGLVPNRFGPINIDGGHRRLNVAVSRARRSLTLIHSLRAEDIRSEAKGPKLLRRYLEYARDGETALEGALDGIPKGEAESPFEVAVGMALEQRGYRIARQLGCAKYYIDIAVMSEDGGAYDLAIECDGAKYHRSPSARDRDRIRQEILEKLGWRGRIHRVWSTNWIRNAPAELAAIEAAIRRARALSRDTAPAPVARERLSLGAPFVEREESSRPNSARGDRREVRPLRFEEYAEADLCRFTARRDLREEDPARIAEVVSAITSVEAPVHVDRVIERIRQIYGLQRTGERVRQAVLAGVAEAVRRGTVAWRRQNTPVAEERKFLDCQDHGDVKPRGAFGDGRLRPASQICEDEYRAAVFGIVQAVVGASRADVTTAVARALGYGRTGDTIEHRIGQTIDRLLRAKKLEERMGSLVMRD
jgi:very-short-patch-repair endonuclease